MAEGKEKTIIQQIEEVVDDMCNNYCRHPFEYDPEEHDGVELVDSGICDSCPLMRLI